MAGHARLSASQTSRWSACPGSAAYLEAHPELTGGSGHHADMGTAAHALGERCLREGSEPSDYAGRLVKVFGDGTSILKEGARWPKDPQASVFEVDVDMHEAVECFTSYVRRRCVELGLLDNLIESDPNFELAMAVSGLVERGVVRLEEHVVPLPERDDTGGTADVSIDAWPEVLETVDYKNGAGVFVPVEGNKQLRSYSLGTLNATGDAARDYDVVRYTIVQPRHLSSPPDGVMSEETTPEELFKWAEELGEAAAVVDEAREVVKRGADLEKLYNQGFLDTGEDGKHCTFCDLLSTCPAARARVEEQAVADFDDEPAEVDVPTGSNHLSTVLPWVPFIDRWIKAVQGNVEHLLLSGGTVAGQKLVRKQSSGRKWAETREVPVLNGDGETVETEVVEITEEDRTEALVEYGAKREDLYTEPVFLSGPQAEKLIPKKHRGELTDLFMFKPEGGLTVAPEDDPRDAVVVDPASDFDEVED